MYAMYLRKSRADKEAEAHGAGETLARHRETLFKLAARNGHEIGRVYAEIVSGETIAGRPQMRKLLADLGSGLWEGVYVMEVERLARGDTLEQGRVAQVFRLAGAAIVTPGKTYDPDSEFDEEVLEFGLFLSRREYKTINRRLQAGRMASLAEGKFIGSVPPFGYTKVKLQKDKGFTLEENPKEAPLVREIFSDFADGLSVREISEKCAFSPCRIYRLLRNPVYAGSLRWGKTRQKKCVSDTGGLVVRRQSAQGTEYAGLHRGLVSKELFEKVQRRLGQRGRRQRESLCKGLLVCGSCGAKMRVLPEDGRHKARVVCPTRGCGTVRSNADVVEEKLLCALFPETEVRRRFLALPYARQQAFVRERVGKILYEKAKKGDMCRISVQPCGNVAPDVCDEFFSLPIFPQNPCASTSAATASVSSCSRSCCT